VLYFDFLSHLISPQEYKKRWFAFKAVHEGKLDRLPDHVQWMLEGNLDPKLQKELAEYRPRGKRSTSQKHLIDPSKWEAPAPGTRSPSLSRSVSKGSIEQKRPKWQPVNSRDRALGDPRSTTSTGSLSGGSGGGAGGAGGGGGGGGGAALSASGSSSSIGARRSLTVSRPIPRPPVPEPVTDSANPLRAAKEAARAVSAGIKSSTVKRAEGPGPAPAIVINPSPSSRMIPPTVADAEAILNQASSGDPVSSDEDDREAVSSIYSSDS
jgi:hypothetical protein